MSRLGYYPKIKNNFSRTVKYLLIRSAGCTAGLFALVLSVCYKLGIVYDIVYILSVLLYLSLISFIVIALFILYKSIVPHCVIRKFDDADSEFIAGYSVEDYPREVIWGQPI